MKKYIEQSKQTINALTLKVAEEFNSGIRVVRDKVGSLTILVSSEKTNKYATLYDEKHYFVIPYKLSEAGFTLHTMRCLPDSIPGINDLPKRRVFHLPNEHYEASLKQHLIEAAKETSTERTANNKSSLENLADDIDSLDRKLTYGMLLIGGIAAFVNPLVGAGIAAKALLPGVGGLANKYGLRPLAEKMSLSKTEKEALAAEAFVMKQFSESNTLKVVNPILQELELALRTTESEHDPLIDPNLANGSLEELSSERWRDLTQKAIYHVYKDILENKKLHKAAQLGPEDLRWLKVIFSGIQDQ